MSDIIIENQSPAVNSTTKGIIEVGRETTLTLGANTTLINTYGPAISLDGTATGNRLANLIVNSNVNVTGNIVVANNYYTIKIAGPLSSSINILLSADTVSAGTATNITAADGYTLTPADVAKLNLVNENYHLELSNGQVIVAEDAPAISVTESLDFGPVRAGYTTPPAAQTVTVTNTSDAAVTLTQPESTANFTVGALPATELAAGATATFEVTPKAGLSAGAYTDTITVNSTGGGVAPTCSAKLNVCYTFECAVTGLTDELPSLGDVSTYFSEFGFETTAAVRAGGIFYIDPARSRLTLGFTANPGYKLGWSIDQYAAGDDETVLTHWDVAPNHVDAHYNYKATITVSSDEAYTTVATGSASAAPGATVTVPVTIANNPGFAAFAFTIGYDAGALELTDIAKGDILTSEDGAFTKNIAGNTVTWDDLYNTTATEGTLFTLTFHVKDTVAGDVYPITVSTQGSQVICDENAAVVPALALPGAITVAAGPGELTPPVLIADTTGNTVGQAVYLAFSDDEAWRSAISGITVNTTPLTGGQYTISAGAINIDAGVFTAPGDYTVTVAASGYSDATVTQRMNEATTLYTVTFVSDGATYTTVKAASGATIEAPADPAKEDHVFDGWYVDEAWITAVSFPYTVTGDVTLYAKWTP
ncbi:hemoblobin-interacting domain-containing protein, partial [Pelotomaculum sp. FP]|uniref:hemoblobin-interacting domain-containing protein n=1 Tax=Pelotomaculum sp. FP TaxID=261474 RepID=UPI0018646F94